LVLEPSEMLAVSTLGLNFCCFR